jgi:hypothetical protein
MCAGELILRQLVDEAEDGRCDENPSQLIPVKEWEAEERGCLAVVKAGKDQRDDRQQQEPQPSAVSLFVFDWFLHAPSIAQMR